MSAREPQRAVLLVGDLCLTIALLDVLLVLLPLPLQLQRLLVHELRVVAAVVAHPAVLQLVDLGDGPVQEVAVVRHYDDRALEVEEVVLQPLHGIDVQMVRWLVEYDQIGLLRLGQDLGQVNFGLLPAAQLGDLALGAVVDAELLEVVERPLRAALVSGDGALLQHRVLHRDIVPIHSGRKRSGGHDGLQLVHTLLFLRSRPIVKKGLVDGGIVIERGELR